MNRFNTIIDSLSFIDNKYIILSMGLFLIIYVTFTSIQFPQSIPKLINNPFFKLLILFLIIYITKKNSTIAIIAVIGLIVTVYSINKFKFVSPKNVCI